ncbi:MAG TPA: hypothetical protein VFY25_15525, partial [Anaerolineales bacterium]|nr:hypothetical protein [Anaerolineales bacterium]
MAAKNIGRGLIVAGIAGIVLSLLVAILPGERGGIRPIQIFLIELAFLLFIVGIWLWRKEASRIVQSDKPFQNIFSRVLDLPMFAWVFAGFLLVYVLLVLIPMFLRPGMQMNYFTGYIP